MQATSLHKRLTKQLKEYRDNGWDIIEQTKAQVDAFRKALPLIMDLKNVALRTRHWEEIRALIGRWDWEQLIFRWIGYIIKQSNIVVGFIGEARDM